MADESRTTSAVPSPELVAATTVFFLWKSQSRFKLLTMGR